ncbi:MAG: sugar ABC transporter ATP-binding protein [Eubacteriales bacterium]|nr:sugar ABC transporter ATP-binding protein [Eubacteriales bacterium]
MSLTVQETNKKDLLSVSGITKRFGLNVVLKGIDLSVAQGEVLTLIGGNGAGKSTLMKIIMGIYQPDQGEMYIDGEKITSFKPSVSLQKGIYMVPQEPMLFPNMSVEENILIGFTEPRAELHNRLVKIIEEIGWKLDLTRKALSLSIAEQQLVELLRGMMRNAKVLILDEPTSALTFDEVESLFKIVEDLKNKGIGIIYITHRMGEVFTIGTHVAIMRDGIITLRGPIGDFTRDMLVKGLLPPNMDDVEKKESEEFTIDYENLEPVFKLENYSGYGFENINLEVYPGEILGVAGLVGAGRTELATTIFGREKVLSGKAYLMGKDVTGVSTREAIAAGINYVPEDRRLNGLFGMSSVAANTTSSLLFNVAMGKVFLNRKKEKEITQKYIEDFRTKVTGQEQSCGSLSGGNQQKVVIGRCLSSLPKLVILDEPTRGIDAAARGDVYSIILELRKQGVAVMLISSDMEEIIELSDRAVVMFQGHMTRELKKNEIDQNTLMNASFDVKEEKED